MTRRYQVVTLFASGALLAVSGALMAGEPGKTSATAETGDVHQGHRSDLSGKMRGLPSQGRDGADVAGHL